MNRQKLILFVTALALFGATAAVLAHAKANQKLGQPGVKTRPLPGSENLEVILPANVPGFQSEWLPEPDMVTNMLPKDTSFGQRAYTCDDGFRCVANVVLMGSSRTSIHRPQVCLTAQGWNINDAETQVKTVHMDQPYPYDLPFMRMVATKQFDYKGQKVVERGIYAYWFVDADRYTALESYRSLWMAHDVLFKGQLDRWAYISFFTACAPEHEEAAFERMKKLIAASVPQFQLVPNSAK